MRFHHRFHELQKLITLRMLCHISLRPSNQVVISFYMILVIALTVTSVYSDPNPTQCALKA